MVQAWRKVDFGTGTVTFLDDTQKEDMLQVEYPNGFLLDMGWYQDRYIICNDFRTYRIRFALAVENGSGYLLQF